MTTTDVRGQRLTERQAALLALLGSHAIASNTGPLLSRSMRDRFGLDALPAGVHRIAASLVRLGLAERVPGASRMTVYRLTALGLSVRANHRATQEWCRILSRSQAS